MDTIFTILLWLHFVALGLAGAASFGLPVVGAAMGKSPQAQLALGGVIKRLTMIGRGAVVALIVTGVAMIGLRYGGSALPMAFNVKMALLVVLLGLMIYEPMNRKRAMAGDASAQARVATLGMAGMTVYVLIILCAILAFA